jgi:pantoate--beta-alanine ligase
MGYLHTGHASLVRRAAAECDLAIASIFVNPSQFDRADDLAAYPRDIDRDRALLEAAGCRAVFVPEATDVYRPGHQTWVVPGDIASPLEGASRPGHFRGVATVVLKLFHLVQPTRAYFGQKDAQQVAVIRTMVRDLDVPVEIIPCPTVREPDGLAMSSRNSYLTPTERAAAPVVYRALEAARIAFEAGERDAETLRAIMRAVVATEPLARLDYASIADAFTLAELHGAELARAEPTRAEGGAVASIAVFLGRARLIDNLLLPAPTAPAVPARH